MNLNEILGSLKSDLKEKKSLEHRQTVRGQLFGVRLRIFNFKF